MDLRPDKLARLMASDNGVEELMKQPVYENAHGYYSQAELLADVVNILRMDAKRMGELHGVEVRIQKMTPEKMAWMLAEMVDGNTQPLVGVFNDIEDYHHDVMEEALGSEEFADYLGFKETQLYTVEDEPGSKRDPEEVAAEIDQRLDDAQKDDLDIVPDPIDAVDDPDAAEPDGGVGDE